MKTAAWVKSPLDAFVLSKLEKAKGVPTTLADKETLIRRATFDLIGLLPTRNEVEQFLNDQSPDAFAKVADRLLASTQVWGTLGTSLRYGCMAVIARFE